MVIPRHRRDFTLDPAAWTNKQRIDEVFWREAGLPHHRTDRLGAAKTTGTIRGKGHTESIIASTSMPRPERDMRLEGARLAMVLNALQPFHPLPAKMNRAEAGQAILRATGD